MPDSLKQNPDKVVGVEAKLRERAELLLLADQFVDEGRISRGQADEISKIKDPKFAREKFLSFVRENHLVARSEVFDKYGNGRHEGVDVDLA